MALLRMTDKKLAANRANAKKSKGPVTPAGKEKVSGNACKHHLHARMFPIPAEWKVRIWAIVEPCIADVQDPVERAHLIDYLVLSQWVLELIAWQTRVLDKSIARHRSYCWGLRACVQDSLYFAIDNRVFKLRRHAERARIEWEKAKRNTRLLQTIPQMIENAAVTVDPKTLISANSVPTTPIPATNHRCRKHPAPPRRQTRSSDRVHPCRPTPDRRYMRILPSRPPPRRARELDYHLEMTPATRSA